MTFEEWCYDNGKEFLLDEWNYANNGDFKPSNISHATGKKYGWHCGKCDYRWKATTSHRKTQGCPVCGNKVVKAGFNDLATAHPDVAKQWHKTMNGKLCPEHVTSKSGKKVWWQCDEGHEWQSTIANRVSGKGCPFCAGKAVKIGYNDFESQHPMLAKEFHQTKNGKATARDFTSGSSKKVWWECPICKHEWQATIVSRTQGNGCPVCGNKKVLVGFNDLSTTHPEIANTWHPTKNEGLLPQEVIAGSHKQIWWQCEKGHEWKASIVNRTNRGSNCPYCHGLYPIKGQTDLKTKRPDLAAQWHPTKNGTLNPEDVTVNSYKKAWWLCRKGHSWQSTIDNRNKGNGCPHCNREMKTSFPEQAIYFYVQQIVSADNRKKVFGKEIDVFIPSWKIGIEYDGKHYHYTPAHRLREKKKDACLFEKGIQIIRVKESSANSVDWDKKIIYYQADKEYTSMIQVFQTLSEMIYRIVGERFHFDVDVERDRIKIMGQYIETEKENSLALKRPEVAFLWDYESNGSLKPESFSNASNKIVNWKCSLGHSWQRRICNQKDWCQECRKESRKIDKQRIHTQGRHLPSPAHCSE